MLIRIFKLCLNIIYILFKLLPVKNKVTLISRQYNSPSQDFTLLKEGINKKYPEYKVVTLTKKIEDGMIDKLLYAFHIFVQMYHISTSKAVILDTYCIPISILKQRKGLIVIQMWHAMGALKKFGYSVLGKAEGSDPKIAKLMNMHKNYTYVLTSSKNTIPYFAEAFNVDPDIVKPIPLPRVDLLSDDEYVEKQKIELYKKYPELKKKKNIVYVPTFRKNGKSYAKDLIDVIDTDKYNLIIKEHPLVESDYNKERVFEFENDSQKALMIADYVITDYSAIMFEASILNKPIFLYTPDIEDYDIDRGFYIDFRTDLSLFASPNVQKIIEAFNNSNILQNNTKQLIEKYIEYKESATNQIIKLLDLN